MTMLLILVHVIACAILIILVLIQRGRGAGLVEGFAGVESMFGTKTSAFLTRTTTIMSIVFFLTCLSLAFLSVQQGKSLMSNVRAKPETKQSPAKAAETKTTEAKTAAVAEAPKTETKPAVASAAFAVKQPKNEAPKTE